MAEIASGREDNSKYEKMSVDELPCALDVAKENLRQKRKDFNDALDSHQIECIAHELSEKQKAMQDVLAIEAALRKKEGKVEEEALQCTPS